MVPYRLLTRLHMQREGNGKDSSVLQRERKAIQHKGLWWSLTFLYVRIESLYMVLLGTLPIQYRSIRSWQSSISQAIIAQSGRWNISRAINLLQRHLGSTISTAVCTLILCVASTCLAETLLSTRSYNFCQGNKIFTIHQLTQYSLVWHQPFLYIGCGR